MAQSLRFTDWQILPAERVLLIRDSPAPIGGRAFDVLLALVAAGGAVVSKRDAAGKVIDLLASRDDDLDDV